MRKALWLQPSRIAALAVLLAFFAGAGRGITAPALPVIPGGTFNVTNYGGLSSSTVTNTAAISNAIFAASAGGGGTVIIPAGNYLTGPFSLKSKIRLQLDLGATLKMLPYGSFPASATELITASSLNNVEISGGGVIEGQGSPWWAARPSTRPVLVAFSSCHTVLVQNVTFQNSPKQHLTFKGSDDNVTIQGITINAPANSPNTDGIDLIGTTCLVQNSSISVGDDNIALGSTGGTANGIVISNCFFGTGHGLSIGSNTSGGVSNVTVLDCSFNGTQYGIRMKSDNATSSGGAGGIAMNLKYLNLTMTNMVLSAIVIYSYYNSFGTPTSISPNTAADMPVGPLTSHTPVWRDILISNVTASVNGPRAGIIWGRREMPVTNIFLKNVDITAPGNFQIYNVTGLTVADCVIRVPSAATNYTVYNAQMTMTNGFGSNQPVRMDGLSGTNSLALYHTSLELKSPTLLGFNPLLLSDSTVSNAISAALPDSGNLIFTAGMFPASVNVMGDLDAQGFLDVADGPGFGPGVYTLFRYSGSLLSAPGLRNVPAGFHCLLNTNTPGAVLLSAQFAGVRPELGPVQIDGAGAIFSGKGGQPLASYRVLVTTNLSLPLSNWNIVGTNFFDSSGAFAFTNSFSSAGEPAFITLSTPAP